jgi:hypothetical protein
MEQHFNWVAYGVAVLAQIIIGFIWYHPKVFGTAWARVNGFDINNMKRGNNAVIFGLMIVFTLIFTFWLMINVTGPGQEDVKYHTFQHGVAHATLLTVMVVIPLIGTPALFEQRGAKWVLIHAGHWFVRMAAAQGILSMWR